MSELDRAQAILYGLALGDALGGPIEFLRMEKIEIIYGEEGIQEPPTPASITDETQTSAAIAEALVESGLEDVEAVMAAISRNLIEWSNSAENTRAPGHTVIEAIRTLEAGVSWREAGVAAAKGNGAAVRMAPIGFLYQHHPERLREVAHACGIATHAHPSSDAASIAAAYLIKLALDGVPPQDYVGEVLRFTDGISDEFDTTMLRIGHVSEWTDEFAAITHVGDGWVASEAVAMAVYCAMRYPDDYAGAIRRAVNIPGDSDSVGSITGGLVAARLGLAAIPPKWTLNLELSDYLTQLATRLAATKEGLG